MPLPTEIYYAILNNLTDSADLCACALASRVLASESQRLIFQNVILTKGNVRNLQVVLSKSQRLRELVDHLTISLPPYIKPKTQWFHPTLQRACAEVVEHLSPSLSSLSLLSRTGVDCGTLSPELKGALLSIFARPTLNSVSLHLSLRSLAQQPLLASVLEACPSLTELTMSLSPVTPFPFLNFELCPKLKTLGFSGGALPTLDPRYGQLEGNGQVVHKVHLEELRVDYGYVESEPLLLQPSAPFYLNGVKVLTLQLGTGLGSLHFLQELLYLCAESLEVLELNPPTFFVGGMGIQSSSRTSFPRLRTVQLGPLDFIDRIRIPLLTSVWNVATQAPPIERIHLRLSIGWPVDGVTWPKSSGNMIWWRDIVREVQQCRSALHSLKVVDVTVGSYYQDIIEEVIPHVQELQTIASASTDLIRVRAAEIAWDNLDG